MKKKFLTGNCLLLICAAVCLVCYDIFGGLWLKGVTSMWFVILGLLNLIYAVRMKTVKLSYPVLMMSGLFLGMCADVLLGVEFMAGIVSFALGHVMYLIAFFCLEKARRKDLMFILPLIVLSIFAVAGTPFIRIEDPVLKKMLIGYAVIIACMLGKAASNALAEKSISRKLIFLGSTMFWFSDLILAIDMFGTSSRMTWILCSYTYWPAQNILAFAMYYYVTECLKKEEIKESR